MGCSGLSRRMGTQAGHLFLYVINQPPKANSAIHPCGVGKWVPASAGKAKAGMVHSVSGWTQGVQVKLWDPLRMRAIPEHLRGVFTTRHYTNSRLPLPYRPRLEETCCQVAYCKHTAQGSPNRLTRTVTIVTAAAHHSYIHIPCIHYGSLCNGPIWSGLSTDHRLLYRTLLLWSPPMVQYIQFSLQHFIQEL